MGKTWKPLVIIRMCLTRAERLSVIKATKNVTAVWKQIKINWWMISIRPCLEQPLTSQYRSKKVTDQQTQPKAQPYPNLSKKFKPSASLSLDRVADWTCSIWDVSKRSIMGFGFEIMALVNKSYRFKVCNSVHHLLLLLLLSLALQPAVGFDL
jgi:hypothetical protein